jgi:hydroxyethylthiazole kinase-like sugar kinase family protein
MNDSTVKNLADDLMRGVIATGCVRSADADVACRVMREEMKAMLFADMDPAGKYANERAIALTGGHGLAMASLVTECARRILAERSAKESPEG